MFDISSASGTRSKHTIDIISPDAISNMKLRNLLLVFLNVTPIIPPMVVPNVPKNRPINVVFIKYSKIKISFIILLLFYDDRRFLFLLLFSQVSLFILFCGCESNKISPSFQMKSLGIIFSLFKFFIFTLILIYLFFQC